MAAPDEPGAPRPRLGPGEEFRRIERFLAPLPAQPGVRVGPGDDAAVLDDGTVVSTDLALEGIHFRLDWISPEEAGSRAVRAAVSDLAAMAADPTGVLVSLAVPSGNSDALVDGIMAGVREVLGELGIPLLGGDLSRSPGPIAIDVVTVGRAFRPLLRSGARAGDGLWVTGVLGGAAAAVEAWERGDTPSPAERDAFVRPRPRIAEGRFLSHELGALAGLDLSDGIAGDAAHLAAASGLRAVLDGWRIPTPAGSGLGHEDPALRRALRGGEDFELLVVLPREVPDGGVEEFRRRFDLPLTRVGCMEEGEGVRFRPAPDAPARPLSGGGWDHFHDGSGGDASMGTEE